jgi:hypothetical protein
MPAMNRIPKLLSKTKLMRGYRCLKCIYLTIHHPELEAPITAETQALFDQGNLVGTKAREYYPGGVLVENKPWDFIGALAKTRELIAAHTPIIYEAAFEYMGCYARADIIQYVPETKRWRIFEVKSTTKVKPEHYDDVGLQAWIMAKSGLPIENISLAHLNPDCHYPDLSNLFCTVDVTEAIRERYLDIKPKVNEIIDCIKRPDVPDIDIGPYCTAPTECGFVEHCWQQKQIPDISIFNLPKIHSRKWELYHEGIISLDDPRLNDLDTLQERIVTCFKTNERYINIDAIRAALSTWVYPFVYLDFETINPAIPRYAGCRPFEQVPFQFSVHVCRAPGEALSHYEFLHDNADDPRPTLIPALLAACGESGSIIAYFSRFESERIQALAQYSPTDSQALMQLINRMVDPLPIIRDAVYDNAFAGSFSLKKVAPALLGSAHSYDNMPVANGGDAQRAFEELISPNTGNDKKLALKNAMFEYCKKDTEVMVELVKWLTQEIML